MKVVVFGCGYVGLVSAVCLAGMGHDVLALERDSTRLAQLRSGKEPFHEPGLGAGMATAIAAGRLCFGDAPAPCDMALLAVGTPAAADGGADLSQLHAALDQIAAMDRLPQAIMVRSTVPVGSCAALGQRLKGQHPDWAGVMISNPEFMRQGQAIGDFMQPDRVVIGAEDPAGHALGRALYAPLGLPDTRILLCNLASAELMKYAANTMLATRLALVNELALLAETTGAEIDAITAGLGLDARIGPHFLRPGPGIGGSCFPKDIRALAHQAQMAGAPMAVVEAVIASNTAHIAALAARIESLCQGPLAGRRIAVLGVTFKAGTDDLRNSPALVLIPALQAQGARIVAFDPMAGPAAHEALGGVDWATDAYGAAQGADAAIILTEWPVFAALDLPRLAAAMQQPRLIDLRNLIAPEAVRAAGLAYHGIGRS